MAWGRLIGREKAARGGIGALEKQTYVPLDASSRSHASCCACGVPTAGTLRALVVGLAVHFFFSSGYSSTMTVSITCTVELTSIRVDVILINHHSWITLLYI